MALSLRDARDIIAGSAYVDQLNDLSITVSYPYINIQFELKGLYSIYKYFYEQFVGWEAIRKESPNHYLLGSSFTYFKKVLAALQHYIQVEVNKDNLPASAVLPLFNRDIVNQSKIQPNTYPLPYNSAETEFLTDLLSRNEILSKSAYQYLVGLPPSLGSPLALDGTIMAYEFRNQENSNIFNRRLKERKSLDSLKSRMESLTNEYEKELTSYIARLKDDFEAHTSELSDFKKSKEKTVTDWFITEKGEIESFKAKAKEDVDNIQLSYRNKLKLEEPIKYWSDSASRLKEKGNWLLGGIVGVSLAFALAVYLLLWHTPADLLTSIFDGDRGSAIRWSVVFIIFASIFFVVVRALNKFMFSNFHLARDAEEREKLTYLYLSMIEKGALDEEERKIILQSLFSRSDTGLLKEDSSPTMPNISNLVGK